MKVERTQKSDPGQDIDRIVRAVLSDVLGLSPARVDGFTHETELFGALPELDSMAVAGLLTELEDRLGILIEDDDIDGDTFETFGSLAAFVRAKLG
jgi:acyl carrier protein